MHHRIVPSNLLIAAMKKKKRRQYEQRVREVEHGHFIPLVFTTTGGMDDAASQV